MANVTADPRPHQRGNGAMEPILLTPTEAAAALNISRTKFYELLAADAVKSVKIGKNRRIPTEALREYVAGLID